MHESLNFTDLVTLFENTNERTVEALSKVYDDYNGIYKKIKLLFDNREMSEKIQSKRVLLKPNWVIHNRYPKDEICLRTHDQFLLAGLEVVLSYNPISVMIADAPVQGGKWDQIVRTNFTEKVESLQIKYDIPVTIKDFRRVTFDPNSNSLTQERNPIEDYIIFDVGENSFLEPITSDKKKVFRVTDYDPDRLGESHNVGIHKYCIAKDFFAADIVITLPKIKTHQKAGLTNALKILVGINGDKDYLPHHRKGSAQNGGDCYPGKNYLRTVSENILDIANRRRGKKSFRPLRKLSTLLWKLSLPSPKQNLAAAWYGNDTTWRMTLDLNRIAEFGDVNGKLHPQSQRNIYSLTDGIIGGQGDGPLRPDPLALGVICFSNNSANTDAAMTKLMGYDIHKIPLVLNAIIEKKSSELDLSWNGETIDLDFLEKYSVKTQPPPGWADFL